MGLLLVIIYLAFISLGLPDSLLGSAWPSIYGSFGVSIESAGIISIIVSACTVASSLSSDRIIRRFGVGKVTFISVVMTALALIGFSFSSSFALLCIFAIPLGFGAGSVDAALNNFVALHYKAKHMSWLHCFWGVGASLGPIVMACSLLRMQSWHAGYRIIGILQFALVAVLLLALPLWEKIPSATVENVDTKPATVPMRRLIRLSGTRQVLLAFFCYCGIEHTVGLWGSSYLVTVCEIAAETAAGWISLYFIGITFGRLLSGFFAIKLQHRQMIRLGLILIGVALVILLLPIQGVFVLFGLFLLGLGLAPIFPSLIHETPINFGSEYSGAMIGLQMACAYLGMTCMPPLFGRFGAKMSYALFPVFLGALFLLMIFMIIQLYKRIDMKECQ